MIDVNVDDFYHDMAVILLSLYQQFPQKVSLYIDDICGPDETDEFGLHSKRYLSAIGALMWLHDESYIRYRDIVRQESAEECTLTQKAFVKLIQPIISRPETAQDKQTVSTAERFNHTLIQQLHTAVKDQSGIDVRLLIETYFLKA